MSIVRIDLWEGRDSETRRELIRAVSEVVSERLGVSVDHVRVVLNEIPREN
jgi:4-oxalocrotonate tautomerase family enzyme